MPFQRGFHKRKHFSPCSFTSDLSGVQVSSGSELKTVFTPICPSFEASWWWHTLVSWPLQETLPNQVFASMFRLCIPFAELCPNVQTFVYNNQPRMYFDTIKGFILFFFNPWIKVKSSTNTWTVQSWESFDLFPWGCWFTPTHTCSHTPLRMTALAFGP